MKKEIKVGDRVRVKSDLVVGKFYGRALFAKTMQKYLGKEGVVRSVHAYNGFYIEGFYIEGFDGWCFTPEMVELIEEKKEIKVGDRVRVKSDLVVDELYGRTRFISGMKKYLGKEGVVEYVYSSGSFCIEGFDNWGFTPKMVELIEEKEEIKETDISEKLQTTGLKVDGIKTDLHTPDYYKKVKVYKGLNFRVEEDFDAFAVSSLMGFNTLLHTAFKYIFRFGDKKGEDLQKDAIKIMNTLKKYVEEARFNPYFDAKADKKITLSGKTYLVTESFNWRDVCKIFGWEAERKDVFKQICLMNSAHSVIKSLNDRIEFVENSLNDLIEKLER